VVVFHQIPNGVVADAPGIVRVVFVHDERVSVEAVETLCSGKPHEPPAILQNVNNRVVRQAIVGRQMRKFEIPQRRVAALRAWDGAVAAGQNRLRQRALPGARRDEHHQQEPERKTIHTPWRRDWCGSHRSIFLFLGAARIRIRRFELHRANELPLVFTLAGTIPAPAPFGE
jgi:hypothetical protein